jgi:hypothetical protein
VRLRAAYDEVLGKPAGDTAPRPSATLEMIA